MGRNQYVNKVDSVFISTHVYYRQAQLSGHMDAHTQCGPKVLGLIVLKIEDT